MLSTLALGKAPLKNIKIAYATLDAAAVITLAAASDTRYVLHEVQWSYSAAPAAGALTVAVGVGPTTILSVDITAAGPGAFQLLKFGALGEQMIITLADPGGSIVSKLSVTYSKQTI
jgi:hypothetical protein